MKYAVVLTWLLICGCHADPLTWHGIPPGVHVECTYYNGWYGWRCVGGGVIYDCVRGSDTVECAPLRGLGDK